MSLRCSKCGSADEAKRVKLFWDTLIVNEGALCVDCMEFVSGEILSEFGLIGPKHYETWTPKEKFIVIG